MNAARAPRLTRFFFEPVSFDSTNSLRAKVVSALGKQPTSKG